jgi:hypothetical protein
VLTEARQIWATLLLLYGARLKGCCSQAAANVPSPTLLPSPRPLPSPTLLPCPPLLQGTVKAGLERLREMYRTKARQLGADLLALQEQLDSRRDMAAERGDDIAALEGQVGGCFWRQCWPWWCLPASMLVGRHWTAQWATCQVHNGPHAKCTTTRMLYRSLWAPHHHTTHQG